ncbi:MAG TPA: DUF58 domain-containing protein [Verrucomicrobiales bacterium]|nr:DUF58 domain-containing protein [Verrucomicrobiales bacterium]
MSAPASNRIDVESLMRIRSLELRARLILEGFLQGLHRSPYHGSSVEFSEYRAYSPGDDLRHLDWKLMARSDRLCIRKFEAETNLECRLLVDLSRSMRFGSGDYTKAEYAATLAATFAWFLLGQGDAVGMMTFASHILDDLPPSRRKGQLQHILAGLVRESAPGETDVKKALDDYLPRARRRCLTVLVSDLLAPIEGLQTQFGYLARAGHDVVVYRILDPAELDFGFSRTARFEDLETGRILYLNPATAGPLYRQRFQEHDEALRALCRRHAIDFLPVRTDASFFDALYDLLRRRSGIHQKRKTRA